MRVKFWGVRGSVPAPISTEQLQERLVRALTAAKSVNLSDTAEVRAFIDTLPLPIRSVVGGNTTCVEITTGDDTIIIDCGTGMRALGYALMNTEFGRGQGLAHIFLTHAHWDHLQGFPFFAPAYVPGNKLIFYAVNHNPRDYLLHQQVAPAYFPITPDEMPATMEFVQLEEGEQFQIGRTAVTSMALYHPGTAYAYRFDDGESVFVFASDGEYKSLDSAGLDQYINFFHNADALAFDCQFSLRDVLLSKADWGHSSAMIGVEIAERARVDKLITTHYDPADTDDQIYNVADSARRYASLTPTPGEVEVIVGHEGLELFLGPPLDLEILEDRDADVWLLAFAGKLNADTAAKAQQHITEFMSAAPDRHIILDLTLLSMIDSVGVRAVVTAVRAVPGSQIAYVAPAAFVRRYLENTGARLAGQIFRDRSHAIASLVGPAHLHLHEQMLESYMLGEVISADDYGAIYTASRANDRNSYVIQVLGKDIDQEQRNRFAQSASAWCKLTHPRIVPGRDVLQMPGGLVAFVSERPIDTSWHHWLLDNGGRVAFDVALRFAREAADILAHAHRNDVVHGELRPECVVFTNGQVRLSRALLVPPQSQPSFAYSAPEQLLRQRPATAAADQFALGVMLYEALMGSHPFAAEQEEMMMAQLLQGIPLSPRVFRPDISETLEDLLLRLLARNPADRFASTEDLLDALESL